MGPRWALVFSLVVLGIARSAQGDSRFPLNTDFKDKMMRYGDVKIPEWNKARLNSVDMSDGIQQPVMTQGALARNAIPLMDTVRSARLRREPKGGGGGKGGGGKGGKGLTKAERDAFAEGARLALEEKRKREEEKRNQG